MSVGARIKEERERLDRTIPSFAALAGVSKNTVIDWQNDVSSPPVAKLVALAGEGFDVLYVVTGIRAKAHRRIGAVGQASALLQQAGAPKEVGTALMPALVNLMMDSGPDISEDEEVLLASYRLCALEDKEQVRKLAERLARIEAKPDESMARRKGAK